MAKININLLVLMIMSLSILSSCDKFKFTKAVNLVDIPAKTKVELNKNINFSKNSKFYSLDELNKFKKYRISKYNLVSQPIKQGNNLFYIDAKANIYCFSTIENKIIWESNLYIDSKKKENISNAAVTYSNGKIFAVYGKQYLVILDAKNGTEIIRKNFYDALEDKVINIDKNIIFVNSLNNNIYGYDIKQNKIIWHKSFGNSHITIQCKAKAQKYNDNILYSSSTGVIASIDGFTGKINWVYNAQDSLKDVSSSEVDITLAVAEMIIYKDYGYIALSNDKLVKLDLYNGVELSKKYIESMQNISRVDKYLFVNTISRQVIAVDLDNFTINWVGNLIEESKKDFTKKDTIFAFAPILTKSQMSDNFDINIITNYGMIYKFIHNDFDNNANNSSNYNSNYGLYPNEVKVDKKISYILQECCSGQIYYFVNNKLFKY